MYINDLTEIIFFNKSIKFPSEKFNILDYVEFGSGYTRSAGVKLKHKTAPTNNMISELLFLSFTQTVEQYTNNRSIQFPTSYQI